MKIQICFPTLQKFPSVQKDPGGHYWLVNLKIKAQRFVIYDSLATNGESLIMDACHLLIASIKKIWTGEYRGEFWLPCPGDPDI
jgi:hypothetical protein